MSYLPAPGDPAFSRLTAALDTIFDRHQQEGVAPLAYRTHAFLGSLD